MFILNSDTQRMVYPLGGTCATDLTVISSNLALCHTKLDLVNIDLFGMLDTYSQSVVTVRISNTNFQDGFLTCKTGRIQSSHPSQFFLTDNILY